MLSERMMGRALAMEISGQVERKLDSATAKAAFIYYMMDLMQVRCEDVFVGGGPREMAVDSAAECV